MKKTIKRILASLMVVVMVLTAAPLSGFVGFESPNIFDIFASAESYSGTCGDNLTWSFDESTCKLTISGTGEMYNFSYASVWNSYCSSIKSVSLPNGLKNIGNYAFRGCSSLTSVTIPDSVTNIGNLAFSGCTGLTSVTIPDSVTNIGNSVFSGCTGLTSVTIPDSVTTIGDWAFTECTSLTSVTIPDSVTNIGDGAFEKCTGLTNVTIGNSVTYIERDAFYNCTSLKNVYYTGDIAGWCGITFSNSDSTPMYYADNLYIYGELVKDIVIPDSVTTIGNYAFRGCGSLTSVTIPDSVTNIGDGAFEKCTGLTSVTIGNSVTSIGIQAFYKCTGLTNITIGNGVTSIGNYAFYGCDSITELVIPFKVSTIGDNCFYNCSSLKNVKFYNNVRSIGYAAFSGCFLSNLYFEGTIEDWCKIDFDYISHPILNGSNPMEVSAKVYFKGKIMSEIVIPSEVNDIGYAQFAGWDSIESVVISSGVETIGICAFEGCSSISKIVIEDTLKRIDSHAFSSCRNLTSIIIPKSTTSIGRYAFSNCKSLTKISLPNLQRIDDHMFTGCSSLEKIYIPLSVKTIASNSFNSCNSLSDVYYSGSQENWNDIIVSNGNDPIFNATIHYSSDGIESDLVNYSINIPEDMVFIEKDEHYLFSAYDKDGNDIRELVNWSSTTSVDCTGEVKITNNGDVQGVKEGLTDVHVTYRPSDDLNELCFDSCYVFVGDPSELKYTSVSDSIYYYGENAFYSDAGQFSDSVDIYIALENAIHEQIEFLTEYDEYADEFEKLAINGYTLYASVSGSNLSFDKDEYINNYISAFDGNIPIDKAVDELLTLYPYNLDVSSADKSFTVTIKIESEDFETITDSFTFKISSLEDKEINEHISFINSNGMYKAMRDEDFATGMSDLKNDSQYIWSKYSTLDFENYHEVLMADILVQLMETQLVGNISLLPVLKEWKSNYDTILGSVSTMVEDSYAGSMEITDNLLDKVIKKSKYTTEGMDVHDEVRDLVVLKLRDKVSIDKINKAFAAVDKTGQCLDLFDMGVNITNDIADWVDCVSIMNSYQNMNEEFKNVIQKVYDCIPNDDWKVKEAVNHYVKLDTTAGYTQEVIESVIELSKDITLEVFNSVFKEQFISMFTNAIGSITLKSGALLSSTTAFSAISTGLGAISTGATLGLCISDILCNNSGQAEEMGKVVAASQLAPYVIQTLKYYEWALKNYKDESSLKHFEVAFNLNKALQIYSIEHTYKGLEIQANSIIIKLFSRRDYPGAMAELASLKTSHINCNCCEDVYTGVIKTKTIAIKCPVDVYIYDENGKEVVRIINDVAVYVENGINVFINGREKYVTVPADQEYSVKIVASDEGTMDYLVIEHDENGQYDRIVKSLNIDLNKNQTFTGKVCEEFDVNKDSYALNTNGNVIKPSASIDASDEIGGICGDNLTWAFDKSTGELVISGTGDMYENGDEWNEYRDSIVAVIIENGVTSIIDYAFSGYANLVDIVIPDSVTKVGRQICRDTPFYENQANWENGSLYIGNHLIETKYDYVGICTIKDGTKTIASSAFYDCYDLTGVIIPESVIGIGDTAFYSCYRLEQVSIPKNVLKIGDDAFGYCDVLQYINVDVHNPYYSSVDGVLYNKNRTELICYPMGKTEESFVVPNGVKVIKKSAFELCKLESIIIADSVTIIESIAFKECPNLKSVVLSKNISNIEKYAFIYSTTITDVYYNNTRDAWNRIKIEEYNDPLLNSIIHFAGKVHSISIDDISMSYKDSATISPAIYADLGVKYTVSYSSSDDSVVSVDQNGKITTRDTGSATITVTVTDEYGNTVSDTCNVEVKYTWWQWIIVIVLFGWIWY